MLKQYAAYYIAIENGLRYNKAVMELVLYSVTYHDCPVEHREKVALTEEQQHELLSALLEQPGIAEAAILQTCNRTEIYLYGKNNTVGFLGKGRIINRMG